MVLYASVPARRAPRTPGRGRERAPGRGRNEGGGRCGRSHTARRGTSVGRPAFPDRPAYLTVSVLDAVFETGAPFEMAVTLNVYTPLAKLQTKRADCSSFSAMP